ncbi:unnamed protein product, partial [Polarella glacialis]
MPSDRVRPRLSDGSGRTPPSPRSKAPALPKLRGGSVSRDGSLDLSKAEKDRLLQDKVPKTRRCAGCQALCARIANNWIMSVVTTILTIYALFGDDCRLMFTKKSQDDNFNTITIVTMFVFTSEMVANTFGKVGYFGGFFSWLDLLSTVTLILDVTYVSEAFFGDTISDNQAGLTTLATGTSGSQGSDSAEAARAARMSRAGAKAGRVVRLIRLVRLLRLVKIYNLGKRNGYQKDGKESEDAQPGMDWEEDDTDLEKESAVSKKLQEMTTRRVIILVLVIMLSLPFFQPTMWSDRMPSSGQYGINVLFRRWRDDMESFQPYANATQRAAYMTSKAREVYVDDFYMYAYYHNPFTVGKDVPDSALSSPASSFSRLFYVGLTPGSSKFGEFFLPSFEGRGEGVNSTAEAYDPNVRWAGNNWHYYQGNLSSSPESILAVPWKETSSCLDGYIRGVSLLEGGEPDLACPENLRYNERAVVVPTDLTGDEYDEMVFIFVFDRRSGSQLEAILNTAQTLFICFLLGFGAMTFSQDANRLVLQPIERMISKQGT